MKAPDHSNRHQSPISLSQETNMHLFKRFHPTLLCAFLPLLLLTANCKAQEKPAPNADGFVPIFDGKTLNGWEGDPTYWRVEDGNLVGEITPATLLKVNSFIIWRGGKPGDFELTLDFRISKDGNSGVNYRSEQVADVPNALRGYQADIDGAMHYTGQNYEERARTTLAYRGEIVTTRAPADPTEPIGNHVQNNAWTERTVTGTLGNADDLKAKIKSEDWNTYRIVAKGNHLQHYLNGTLMSDVTDEDAVNRKAEGLIGVQVHVGPPMKVEYRNILLKQ